MFQSYIGKKLSSQNKWKWAKSIWKSSEKPLLSFINEHFAFISIEKITKGTTFCGLWPSSILVQLTILYIHSNETVNSLLLFLHTICWHSRWILSSQSGAIGFRLLWDSGYLVWWVWPLLSNFWNNISCSKIICSEHWVCLPVVYIQSLQSLRAMLS